MENLEKTDKNSVPDSINHLVHDDDDIVTLVSEDGENIDFVEVAGIAYGGNFYAILQPVELFDGMADDEALVFKVSKGSDGEDEFEIEINDSITKAVFDEYYKLIGDLNN